MTDYSYTYTEEHLLKRIRRLNSEHPIGLPSAIQIEITSYCNAICFFCAHTGSERHQQHIKPELFEKLIEEIRGLPHLSILYLTGLGEPMMHPQWKTLYKMAEGLPCAFTTNCSILKQDDIEFIMNLDFQEVAFSLDTLNPERHMKIRGFGVDKVAPKILAALEFASKNPVKSRIVISTTLTYETVNDMKDMFDFLIPAMEKVPTAKWHIKQIGYFPDVKAPFNIIPPMSITKKLNDILPNHPQVSAIQDHNELRPFCTLWFDRVTFLSNGDAVPCCHQAKAYDTLGNIETKTILEIFNSTQWKHSQEHFAKRDDENGWNTIPYCKDCR